MTWITILTKLTDSLMISDLKRDLIRIGSLIYARKYEYIYSSQSEANAPNWLIKNKVFSNNESTEIVAEYDCKNNELLFAFTISRQTTYFANLK